MNCFKENFIFLILLQTRHITEQLFKKLLFLQNSFNFYFLYQQVFTCSKSTIKSRACEICSKLTAETPGRLILKLLAQILCLLSTLNIFHNLLQCFCCCLQIDKCLIRLFISVFYSSVISVERNNHVIYKFNILSIQLKISFQVYFTTYSDKRKRQFKQDLPILFTA